MRFLIDRCVMDSLNANSLQFRDDSRLRGELTKEPAIAESMEHGDALRSRARTRAELLTRAVRIDSNIMPSVAAAVASLTDLAFVTGEVECYVSPNLGINSPNLGINAFVTIDGGSRTLIALSSGAVNNLDADELRFLLGHELGHVLFSHLDIDIEGLAKSGSLPPTVCMRLRAWQRAAEISADRVGLVCCGSLEHAARALFKTVSGVTAAGLVVRPEYFAEQWQHLLDEVTIDGGRDHWTHTHPFPPLRMKAMTVFAESSSLEQADREVSRMLALMNPDGNAEPMGDPLLAEFLFWGGLYIALADRHVVSAEMERIQTVAPAGVDVSGLVSEPDLTDELCLRRFREMVSKRRQKLSAVEKHGIICGLIDVASADGHVAPGELQRLLELGSGIGVPGEGCELIVRQYLEERNYVA